ncbi:ankyrin repeat domain-containing protein 12-like, partial [Fundulus heteroclitus]|uniref:ankyrin repeat domain-containing protein 12-like n=1 Tax=Fundulus heteroclitus TaxID=8078 RepID=UPI00165C3823
FSFHLQIVKLLLRHGGNAFQANKRGERPVDVADSQELEQLLKGEAPLSDQDDSSSESEDPPSVNPSSVDDNMEDSDTEKELDGKPATKAASSSVPGMDEYEFKDEEEEEDLSKALNDRHIPRRELRQREKEDKERNHVAGKQSNKGDSSSKSKKQKGSRLHCSSDTSSDELESLPEKRNSPTCSQSSDGHKMDTRLKKDNAEQKDKGKVKKKSKSQNKNKENEEDGKENSKTLVLSLAAVSESNEKGREEDSFKMSFSPKDDSSVHLFHLSSIKSPKLNHSLADKQCPLKQENAKLTISDGPYNHYADADYCTESSSTKGCKHREKSKHQQKESGGDGDDGRASPCRDGVTGNSVDGGEAVLRKTDLDGKVVKKHKLKHKEKDKHRREYKAERSHHRQKEARKEGHRNLEFDREFWKENFFKSDEADEPPAAKKDGEDIGAVLKAADCSPVKDERNSREKHPGGKEKKPREEREKDKAVKKERKEEKVKDPKPGERDEKADGHGSGRSPEESLQNSAAKEETEEKAVTADQEQLEQEKASRDRRLPGKEKDSDKMEKRHLDKEKKVKPEHGDKAEPQNSVDRWKEKDRAGSVSSLSPGDKSYRDNEKLKSLSAAKKHEDGRKSKDKLEKRSDRERQDREYAAGDHKERDRANSDRRGKPAEKADRLKDKDCDRKKKDKMKDSGISSSSNLKLLLEDKRSYLCEGSKVSPAKSKEEAAKTPEKERDRRDRERDYDRHKDKDRHKDRVQQVRLSKAKPGEGDGDKSKPKTAAAARDAKPKEKRLVNDDLMQTSFERMLSMKDQEIELWHRKHLEKIKQKERERLKQRPACDAGKSKPKDRTKAELCSNKELTRSKSSEASDVQGREKPAKDGTGNRTLSLDGKCVPSISAKVISVVESCLSRSPRPEGDRGGLMSRSVSLVSVASSEDSYQATTLTPRHVEYDSDVNLETSDSQQAFLQSSLVIQAARSPSVHDRDCGGLPDVPQSCQVPARHEPQFLQSVLEEDPSSSAESDGVEHPSRCGLANAAGEEPKAKEFSEPEENQEDLNPSADPVTEKEAGAAGRSETQLPVGDLPNKDQTLPQLNASHTEQKAPPSPDPPAVRDASSPPETSQAESGGKEPDRPLASGEALYDAATFQQRETLPSSSTENRPEAPQASDHQPVEPPAQENMDTGSENPTPEGPGSPPPPPTAGSAAGEIPAVQEDSAADNPDKSQPSADDVASDPDVQMEDAPSAVAPEHKTEETADPPPSSESSGAVDAAAASSFLDGASEPKAEIPAEPMDVTAAEERTESSASEDQSLSSDQSAPQTDSGNTSGSSSPQSADRDSDSSGAKLKVRPGDEDVDVHVPHPRKRKMPKLSNSQLYSSAQQEKDKCQQSLAAMVDSVKLEEIEPYQTERANPYYEFLHIRKKIEEKRKVLCNVTPQPPQYYDEYVTFNGSYLLDGNPLSKLCIPTITPPPSLPEPLKEMFKQQEVVRMKLRLQHSIEREKLIVSNEQEVLRVHYRAARTLANQTLPFSACTVLLDAEVYNMPQDIQNDDGKTSVRDRFNARQFMSWLQDVDDKFDKLKTCLLMRQQHEAAALNAVQRLEWQLKLQELDPATYKSTSIFEIPEFYIPLVEVNDDFDLTPI